jgi:hypothetical protein
MYRKNVAGQYICFQGVDATTGGIKSGVTWTIRRSIDGTAAAGGGSVTEDGTTGWYSYAMSQADTNGNNIGFNFTGTGAVPQTVNIITTAANPTDGVRLGLTALPNAAADAAGGLPISDAGGLDLDARLDAAVSSRMASYTQPTGFLAATFPNGTIANTTNITAGTMTTTTNLTNAATAGDFTAVMKTSIGTAVAASAVASVTGNVGGNVNGDVGGNVTGSVGSVVGLTASNLDATVSSRLASASINLTAGVVDADIKKVNGVTVNGDGAGTPWGP